MSARMPPFLLRLAKRLGWSVLTLFGTIVITYLIVYFIPADPARVLAGAKADKETIEAIRHSLGLDRPVIVQFGIYLWHLVNLDWGKSFLTNKGVLASIVDRFPATAELAVAGLLCYLLIGIPLGLWTARHKNEWPDRSVLVVGILIISLPIFYLARMLQYGISYQAELLPVAGMGGLRHLILPALTLGIGGGIYYGRLLHTSLVETLAQDYVRFARARGLPESVVIGRHALRNALIPVATQLGMDFAGLLGGLIFTENVYSWPGIGTLTVNAIFQFDVPMVMGTVLFAAILVVAANVIVDLLYPLLDPRIERAI